MKLQPRTSTNLRGKASNPSFSKLMTLSPEHQKGYLCKPRRPRPRIPVVELEPEAAKPALNPPCLHFAEPAGVVIKCSMFASSMAMNVPD